MLSSLFAFCRTRKKDKIKNVAKQNVPVRRCSSGGVPSLTNCFIFQTSYINQAFSLVPEKRRKGADLFFFISIDGKWKHTHTRETGAPRKRLWAAGGWQARLCGLLRPAMYEKRKKTPWDVFRSVIALLFFVYGKHRVLSCLERCGYLGRVEDVGRWRALLDPHHRVF